MAAEIIGINKVLKWMDQYTFQKIVVIRSQQQLFLKKCDNKEECIQYFKDWYEEEIHNDNFKEYKVELYGSNTAGAKLTKFANINVQFNPSPTQMSGTSQKQDPGFSVYDFVNISNERTQLMVENRILQESIEALEEENEELKTIVDSMPENTPSIGATINTALTNNADKLIEIALVKLMGMGNNSNNNFAVNGVEDANTLLNEMLSIEPNFTDHLKLLINLRKNSPLIYAGAVEQLKSL